MPKWHKTFLIPLVVLTSILTLTPLVFNHIISLSANGRINEIANGPGIALFGTVSVGLVVGGIFSFINKIIKANGAEKRPLRIILTGTLLTFALIITFNFILPAFFANSKFTPLGAVFVFPFILFTSYAIFRHKVLNIKIISTDILIFALALATLFEAVISTTFATMALRFCIFLLVLSLGMLLIQSVTKEVKQKEQLQILTTKLADANDKLKALDQARAEFISIASHQLRTPPATLKWYLAAILSGDYGPLDEGVKNVLVKAQLTNNLQISLIEDLLNVSRIERGKMEFLFEQIDVEQLVGITVEQLQPMAKEKGLELSYKKPLRKLPVIMADKEKLRQVINNLIDNSIKYTRKGCVIVGLNLTEQDEIRFQVTDTGKGIGSENIKTIFDKYTRGNNSVHESTGLGLGLYVAEAIIKQHKGKVWAESPGEGKGSTFIFTIPVKNDLKQTTLLDLTVQPQPQAETAPK